MPPRSSKWSNRIFSGPGRSAPLDFGVELWNWEEGDWADPNLVAAYEGLLSEVVDAAGGVERAVLRLGESLASAQKAWERHLATGDVSSSALTGMMDETTEDVWYSVEEALSWARTLDQRLRRDPKQNGGKFPDGGLISSMAEGPRRDAVITARSHLRDGGVREACLLANLNLHVQKIPGGSKMVRFRDRRMVLPFPDAVSGRVAHRWDLTYRDGRDAESFCDRLWDSVKRFMDEMFVAFETHLPERFRQ